MSDFDVDEYSRCTGALREISAKDPLTVSLADIAEAKKLIGGLRAIKDYEAAACEGAHLRDLVLRAVAKHHHRSADLALAVLEEPFG